MALVLDEPIVFFGAGRVAAAALRMLAGGFNIEAVVTKPRAAQHRGDVPVLDVCEQLHLPVIEAANKKTLTERVAGAGFKSRLAVLIDFGIIVEQQVIGAFPLGIVNSHFSLLPQWRGADPITFAILSGQSKTGVSLMLLVERMDEGPLLAIGECDITPDLDAPELTRRLIGLSDALLKNVLPKYVTGAVTGTAQEKVARTVGYGAEPSYSRKLVKEDGILDWHKPAEQLAREVRAYAEWPKSRCVLGGHAVIITRAHAEAGEGTPGALWFGTGGTPGSTRAAAPGAGTDGGPTSAAGSGTVTARGARTLGVYCNRGILMIDRLTPAGKAEMDAAAFLNGYGKDL